MPLTFHVGYWDRLGWKDPFASAAFTQRQERYARSGRLRSPDGSDGLDGLYTPQMIVDGSVQFSGQRRQAALQEMERAAARAPLFELVAGSAIRGASAELTIQAKPLGETGRDRDWRIVAALAALKTRTAVDRGENAGETLDEAAVVRALSASVAMPAPGAVARIVISKPADLAWSNVELVVFAQSEATREIGAVRALDPR